MTKPLTIEDIACGMALETKVREARAALAVAEEGYLLFRENLRLRYDAPEDRWRLDNWTIGFEPIEQKEANNA